MREDRPKGFFVSFDFTSDALQEIGRFSGNGQGDRPPDRPRDFRRADRDETGVARRRTFNIFLS